MSNLIFDKFADAELVAGVATAGIPWGALVADQLKLPFIYVRPKPKEHGLGNQIEGYFEQGQKTIVVEDLISTGKSSLQVVDVVKQAGLAVDGMVSIFSYGFPVAEEAFKQAGVAKYSLTNYAVLIALALEKGLIASGELATLAEWGQQPSTWRQPVNH
jgi:orotate phosphoribosyltransferase